MVFGSPISGFTVWQARQHGRSGEPPHQPGNQRYMDAYNAGVAERLAEKGTAAAEAARDNRPE